PALLHHQDAERAETYVPTRGRQPPAGSNDVTNSRTVGPSDGAVATRTVIVSAKGAARWQAGHPWIYRTDIYDEPGDTPGIVAVTERRGRPLGQALYSPRSEIRLRLLTRGRETIDSTWWGPHIAAAVARRAGGARAAYRLGPPAGGGTAPASRGVHAEGDGVPSLVVDLYEAYVVAQTLSAGLEQARDDVLAG